MSQEKQPQASPAAIRVMGLILIALMLAAGLLLGIDSTLKLTRDASGAVTAENTWRFADRVPLIKRTVTHLQKVVMMAMNLSEDEKRSSAYRNFFGSLLDKTKRCLVLDREPCRFQRFISNISGQNINAMRIV